MSQKSSISNVIDRKAIQIQAVTHHHNFLPGKDITLKTTVWGKILANRNHSPFFIYKLFLYRISFSYIRSSFTNILPSSWFKLTYLPMFYPSKIYHIWSSVILEKCLWVISMYHYAVTSTISKSNVVRIEIANVFSFFNIRLTLNFHHSWLLVSIHFWSLACLHSFLMF